MTLPVHGIARPTESTNPKGSNNNSPQSPCTHTFDAWRTFSTTYSAQRTVSGKYGVDFRFAPEPNGDERRALKLLDIATKCLGPRVVKKNAERFDYVENYSATTKHAYPCATPSAHIQSAQVPSKVVSQANPSSSPSSSRSKTPRASPTDPDHLQDAFFNFLDDVTPGPPETDVEHEHDTDPDTDTGSERELRIEDLEAPFALQQLGRNLTVRGRQRGRQRDRAGSTSTSTTGSGSGSGSAPGFAPMAALTPPTANRTKISTGSTSLPTPTHVTPTAPQTSNRSSPLRPVYARRGPSAVSESGAGTIGGVGSPSNFGVGLSAAARARERTRGIGTPRSEPDASLAMGMRAVPSGMSGSNVGAFNVGAYGYRYPAHSPYSSSSATTGVFQNTGVTANANIQAMTSISANATQREGSAYGSPFQGQGGNKIPNYSIGSIKAEDTSMSALQSQAYSAPFAASSNMNQNQRWAGASTTTGTTATEDMGMDMDIDMGGWARVSDPLPGMNFSEMIASTPYASVQNQTQSQSQSRVAYGSGSAHTYQQQQQQAQYAVHAQQRMSYGVPQAHQQDVHMSYYASPAVSNLSPSMSSGGANPGLNISLSRWKASNTNPATQVTMSPSSAAVGRSRAQSLGQGQGRAEYWPTSDMRGGH